MPSVRYRLVLESGEPATPSGFLSRESGWQAGDDIGPVGNSGKRFEIVRVVSDFREMRALLGGSAEDADVAYRVLIVRPLEIR
jgi:hypothetical protein